MTLRCAFLTMADTSGWQIDAHLAIPDLEALGWQVESLPWREPGINWSRYDAVYVGTPWDYPEDPERLLAVLAEAESAGAVVANAPALVRWNLQKTYLRDLEARGVAIVPTAWFERLDDATLEDIAERARREPLVLKPVVSTNATDTYPLSGDIGPELRNRLRRVFARRACMLQPFVEAIREEGEYSLFWIGDGFSHAIRKVPAQGDFRVQEEHGARIDPAVPGPELRAAAEGALGRVSPAPLYARADFVRGADGRWLLMELELIEPSLYLRMDEAAPRRFAEAFDTWVRRAKAL